MKHLKVSFKYLTTLHIFVRSGERSWHAESNMYLLTTAAPHVTLQFKEKYDRVKRSHYFSIFLLQVTLWCRDTGSSRRHSLGWLRNDVRPGHWFVICQIFTKKKRKGLKTKTDYFDVNKYEGLGLSLISEVVVISSCLEINSGKFFLLPSFFFSLSFSLKQCHNKFMRHFI